MKTKLLMIGGGGHCNSILDSLLEQGIYDTISILDINENLGKTVRGISIIGTDDDLMNLYQQGYKYAFVAIGNLEKIHYRKSIIKKVKQLGYKLPNIIDMSSQVSKTAMISDGIFVGKNVIINASTTIGSCSIVNTGCIIEHDCVIGEETHIAPGSVICGNVNIGDNTYIGANSTIKQGLKIGKNVIVGMGSVVLHNILENSIEYGNPSQRR